MSESQISYVTKFNE